MWALQLHPWVFTLAACTLALLKVGVGWYGDRHVVDSAAALPDPYNYTSGSIVAPVVYRLLGLTPLTWAVLSTTLVLASVAILVRYVHRHPALAGAWKVALLLGLAWPAVLSSLQYTGHYQSVVLAFLVSSVLAKRWWFWAPLVIGAALSLAEQALLAYLSLLVASTVRPLAWARPRAIVGMIASAAWVGLSSVWLSANGIEGRAGLLADNLLTSLTSAASMGLTGVYSWWSIWWLLVALLLVGSRGRRRLAVLVSMVVIPAVATVATIDGTRVFAMVSSASAVAFLLHYLRCVPPPAAGPEPPEVAHEETSAFRSVAMPVWLVAFCVAPVIVTEFFGESFRPAFADPIRFLTEGVPSNG